MLAGGAITTPHYGGVEGCNLGQITLKTPCLLPDCQFYLSYISKILSIVRKKQ